jgi:hypothetical protein
MSSRILITGSRTWNDRDLIAYQIGRFVGWEEAEGGEVTIVHGACPTGADRIADEIARRAGLTIERHPAEWDRYGKRAGFIRNDEMVKLGAGVVLAFIKNGSRGASMCADLAEANRLSVYRFVVNEGVPLQQRPKPMVGL